MTNKRRNKPEADASSAQAHVPVMLDEVLAALAPKDGGIYIDGTFGAGGYSEALLRAARCRVLGIDRDPESIRRGGVLTARHSGRLMLVEGCFGDLRGGHRENAREPWRPRTSLR